MPKLRFPEFVGEWEEKELGKISSLITKGTTPSSLGFGFVDKGINFIKTENITENGLIDIKKTPKISFECDEKLSRSRIKENDILFSIAGTLGRTLLIKNQYLPANTNQALAIIRLKDKSQVKFINYLLNLDKIDKYIHISVTVGAQPNLSLQQVGDIKLKIPSISEQKKISFFLSKVDKKIEKLEKKQGLWRIYKKGIIQQIFSQKLKFKDENREYYPDWKERKLYDILFEHKTKSTGNEEVFSVSVHKGLVNQVEHLGRTFAAQDTSKYNLVKPGDIVYTKSPTGDFPLGIIKQSKLDKNVIVSPLYGVFSPINTDLGLILDSYFESPINTKNYLHPIVQKGAKNTMNISNNTFLSRSLILSIHEKEQSQIANFLSTIAKKIEITHKESELVKKFKKGLLQQMFC